MKNNVLRIFAVLTLFGASAFAGSVNLISDPNFTNVTVACGSGYSNEQSSTVGCSVAGGSFQQSLNSAWTFGDTAANQFWNGIGADGLTTAGTAFNPPSFTTPYGTFTQAAFLQGTGWVSETVTGLTAGQQYNLDFLLGSRYNYGGYNGDQSVQVTVVGRTTDGSALYNLSSGSPFTLENVTFTASGTSETVTFLGENSGDHTAFLTDVSLTATPEPVSLVLFGTGLVGIGGFVRRRFSL